MEGRRLAAERGLVPRAVAALTGRALGGLSLEALGPTKALLKRYFSAQPWDADAAGALADAVGPGEGWWREPLDDELALEFGWSSGRFALRVEGGGDDAAAPAAPAAGDLAATFAGDVVPEVTPNPRTLAFRTGPVAGGESREYRSADDADDPRVARVFAVSPEVAGVLVARDFVAVSVRRPDRWPALLAPVLEAVAEQFAGGGPPAGDGDAAPGMAELHRRSAAATTSRPRTRLDRAWDDLGRLRASDPADLERLVAATASPDAAHRQVAAGLLGDASPEVAAGAWAGLAGDPSRSVRRAALDAVVDAGREELRPLLEGALADPDAWVRWKALRGLAELGAEASRAAVERLAGDPDFRVRLEARSALRTVAGGPPGAGGAGGPAAPPPSPAPEAPPGA